MTAHLTFHLFYSCFAKLAELFYPLKKNHVLWFGMSEPQKGEEEKKKKYYYYKKKEKKAKEVVKKKR